MLPTTSELKVDVTTNTLGKVQYFPLYDCIDIVLGQCPYNSRFTIGCLTTHSTIYGASSALLLLFFKFKGSH